MGPCHELMRQDQIDVLLKRFRKSRVLPVYSLLSFLLLRTYTYQLVICNGIHSLFPSKKELYSPVELRVFAALYVFLGTVNLNVWLNAGM